MKVISNWKFYAENGDTYATSDMVYVYMNWSSRFCLVLLYKILFNNGYCSTHAAIQNLIRFCTVALYKIVMTS